jgi:hypothetical protein
MMDFIWVLISGFAGLLSGWVIVETFRWGYNKENKEK